MSIPTPAPVAPATGTSLAAVDLVSVDDVLETTFEHRTDAEVLGRAAGSVIAGSAMLTTAATGKAPLALAMYDKTVKPWGRVLGALGAVFFLSSAAMCVAELARRAKVAQKTKDMELEWHKERRRFPR